MFVTENKKNIDKSEENLTGSERYLSSYLLRYNAVRQKKPAVQLFQNLHLFARSDSLKNRRPI